MFLSVERQVMLWGLEAKKKGALLIMFTVSVLSREDSPICPNLASMLFFFQIHEVKRVTALSSARSEGCFSATHPSPQGGDGRGRDLGWSTELVFISQPLFPPIPWHPQGSPNLARNVKAAEWHTHFKSLKWTSYLGDTAGSALDPCNKANIAIKPVTPIFWFPSAYKIYVYTTLLSTECAIVLCLKNVHTLIKKYFIAKKCQLSAESSVSHNLFAGGGFDLLWELTKCDTETQSEQVLVEKWHW